MILNGFWVLNLFGSSTGKVKAKGPRVVSKIVLKMSLVTYWKRYWKNGLAY